MNVFVCAVLAVVLVLAPLLSGLPDEPLWSSWLSAAVMLAAMAEALRHRRQGAGTAAAGPLPTRAPWRSAALPFAALVVWALLSLGAVLVRQHSLAFLGLMLRGGALLAVQFTLFCLARRAASAGRAPLWTLVFGLVAGAAIVAAFGANEYAAHVRAGEPSWRVFATSTPDYLAGYLVMLLPLTLAALLAVRAGGAVALLLGLVAALEMGVMLTTGSRFALVSLVVGLLTFGGALAFALRRGLVLEPDTRRRLLGMAAVLALAALVAAKPVLGRLLTTHTSDNSAAFRVWTWRGAVHMARANPIFGTGIGIWAQTYPRYALTGFTRLAHSGYLQMADECGWPALALLLATLVFVMASALRGLTHPAPPASVPIAVAQMPKGKRRLQSPTPMPTALPSSPDAALPADPRLLLCGLAGSLAAALTQNAIDSDWSVFFIGVSFWAVAGLAVGVAEQGAPPAPQPGSVPPLRAPSAVGAAALAAYFACQGVGALLGSAARMAPTPSEAEADYTLAGAWDPLNGAYSADLGYRVYARDHNLPAAEAALRRAVVLKPDAVNYRRLGSVLMAQGKAGEAQGAWERGLSAEPQSLDLLLLLAQSTPPPSNLAYFRTMARLEASPVGTVRAIGGITEPKFAIADAALGDALGSDPAQAQTLYAQAARGLAAYASESGSLNPQRQAMQGGRADPAQDAQMRELYAHVSDKLIALASPKKREMLIQQREATLAQFQTLLPKE